MARTTKTLGALFINLLGGLHVSASPTAEPIVFQRRRTRALLALLAVDPAHALPRGKLTALLWSEQTDDTARQGLRQCLVDLRQALARLDLEVVRSDGDVIGLDTARIVVDIHRLEQCVARGTPQALEEAIALYRGDFLEGFTLEERAFEDWLQLERERLRSRAVGAFRDLLAHHARTQATDAGVQTALRLLALEPFDETVHRTLIRFYADSGRRTAALRQYEACVEILARELSVEPEAETRALYRELVSQRSPLESVPVGAGAQPESAARVPRVKALDRHQVSAPLIGREVELEWLGDLRTTAHHGQPQLALLTGEAGIGKSRLVGELLSTTQDRGTMILFGRGREGEDVLPFAPWVEALRPALSGNVLGRLAPVARLDLARLFPEISSGTTPPPNGLEDGPRIFEAVAQMLRELTARRRLIVVLEDLHWCDDMTVRLLRFLPRRLEGRPALLLATARPEDVTPSRGPALESLRQDPSCAFRPLGPLAKDEAARLFRSFLAAKNQEPPAVVDERMWTVS